MSIGASTKLHLEPLGGRVIVERMEQEEQTSGGIFLAENAKEKQYKGVVIAVGPGDFDTNGKRITMQLQVGDVVFFAKWGGNEIMIDDQEYLVMKESDIVAKVVG